MWSNNDRAAAYTFSNHCNEDLIVVPASGGEAIPLPASATRTLETVDQDPRQAFVVSRPDGSDATQVVPGMPVFAIEDDICPSDH
jgi:hypothetical protein